MILFGVRLAFNLSLIGNKRSSASFAGFDLFVILSLSFVVTFSSLLFWLSLFLLFKLLLFTFIEFISLISFSLFSIVFSSISSISKSSLKLFFSSSSFTYIIFSSDSFSFFLLFSIPALLFFILLLFESFLFSIISFFALNESLSFWFFFTHQNLESKNCSLYCCCSEIFEFELL